jgi:S-adenosylmethionine hydrolase
MKGVIATRAPGMQVIDVSHGVPAQNVLAGALVLKAAAPFFPPRTVHVAVVDPGVGTARRPLCIDTKGARFIGPDNGVLSLAAPRDRRIRAVEITDEHFMRLPRSRTFDGRDVFAPAAAAVASGLDPGDLGPEVADVVELSVPAPVRDGGTILGQVTYVDVFGNLATNIDAGALPVRVDRVEIAGHGTVPFAATYAAVEPRSLVALVNSWGVLEIALRDGDARVALGAGIGTVVTVVGE